MRADELGCDLVEVTAHAGARPSHALWQGRIFSRSGKSKKYPGLVEVTRYGNGDGLKGWNCSHDFRPYIEGMPRTYSKELLDGYEARNYEYNGQKMTQYEAMQQQRKIERNIRRWKRENAAMKAAGLDTGESAAKLRQWQGAQKDFLSQTGLKRQGERERVYSAGRRTADQIKAQAKKNYPPGVTMSAAGGKLEEKDIYAINQYKSARSYGINAALREKIALSDADRAIVHDIDQALLKLPAYEGTVYRSLRSEEMVDVAAFWRRYQPGAIVSEDAYTSASVELYDNTMDILMVIQSKRGCDMRKYNPLEQEVLFMRGSIFSVEKREGNIIWLTEI